MLVMNKRLITALNPGECTADYADGWRKAEEALGNGALTNGDFPPGLNHEQWEGYSDRMAIHQYEECHVS